MKIRLRIGPDIHDIELSEKDGAWTATVGDNSWPVNLDGGATDLVKVGPSAIMVGPHERNHVVIDGVRQEFEIMHLAGVAGAAEAASGGHGPIHAPMMGKVEEVLVAVGDVVETGQVLFVLEAMKMRNQVKAQAPAVVTEVKVKPGTAVDPKTVVLVLEAPAE